MKLAVVNAFYPPDHAITGRSASALVERLQAEYPDAEIAIFATDGRYVAGQQSVHGHRIHRIRAASRGGAALGRLAASLWDGIRLARLACRDADVVVTMTDPPLLGFWTALQRRRRRFTWVEWTMDLYPEAFLAAGLASRGNLAYRAIVNVLRRWQPDRYICLGALQHRYICLNRDIARPAFLLPCGVVKPDRAPSPPWRPDDRIVLAYAGNVGEAHSSDVLAALARRADPRRIRFIFAAYGSKADKLRQTTGDCPHVSWHDGLTPGELAHADVHIVSLLSKWSHISVPSKATAALCLGRPVLFAGSAETDTWRQIQGAGWLIPETSDGSYADSDVDQVLRAVLDPRERAQKSQRAAALGALLLRTESAELGRIAAYLTGEAAVGTADATPSLGPDVEYAADRLWPGRRAGLPGAE